VVLCDAADGTVVASGSAPHPPGTEVDPQAWWHALQLAGEGLLSRAGAVAVAGQQHGSVVLAADGTVIRPALLWNDLRSAGVAADLVAERHATTSWAGGLPVPQATG
jgi:xylulokinase